MMKSAKTYVLTNVKHNMYSSFTKKDWTYAKIHTINKVSLRVSTVTRVFVGRKRTYEHFDDNIRAAIKGSLF